MEYTAQKSGFPKIDFFVIFPLQSPTDFSDAEISDLLVISDINEES